MSNAADIISQVNLTNNPNTVRELYAIAQRIESYTGRHEAIAACYRAGVRLGIVSKCW